MDKKIDLLELQSIITLLCGLGLHHSTLPFQSVIPQTVGYSPDSSRSTRNAIKRKDSLASSIGATSVRRLIAVVRNTSSKLGPVYTRRVLIKNLIIFCLSHAILTWTFLPFLALQSSVSIWIIPFEKNNFPISINSGAFLLMFLNILGAISSIIAPFFLRKFGNNSILFISYLILVLFYGFHIYPVLYLIIPVYLLFGLSLGPLFISKASFIMTISSRLSQIHSEDDEESQFLRKTCLVRRVSRSFQFSHDLGFIFGSIFSALIINFSFKNQIFEGNSNSSYNRVMDEIFDLDDFEDRLCGSTACPSRFQLVNSNFSVIPENTATVLIISYASITFLGVILIVFLDKIKTFILQDPLERSEGYAAIRAVKESFKDFRLQLSAPLSLFIGLEQSFMYSDFSKSYVVCTLGINRLNWVFLCMGLLQSIAAFTLSMLMRSVKRYYLIGVGFTFHCCLLLVQMLWKPINDDPALFYVISAAWGVCNAIWEMLNYTFLTSLYINNFEAAFANQTFFKFLGLSLGFGAHCLLCNWIKVYLLGFGLILAAIPNIWLEMKLEGAKRLRNISRL
nr:UNC93-like protein [Onthophagus taurus]